MAPTDTPAPTEAVPTGDPTVEPTDTLPPIALGGGPNGATQTPDALGAGPLGSSGGSGGGSPTAMLALVLVAFTIGGGFAIIAARRRRPKDEQAQQVPAPAYAAASAYASAPVGGRAAAMADPTVDLGAEAGVPRWRRASLRAARQSSERDIEKPTYQLAFNAAASEGTERRLVRYRVVRLMDGPDEIRSQEVGQLEENDELEVLGRYAGYVHVRTPVGTEGWVHRTTLGPAIGTEEPAAEVGPPEFDLQAAFQMRRNERAATQAVAQPAVVPDSSPPPEKPARSKSPRSRAPKAEPST